MLLWRWQQRVRHLHWYHSTCPLCMRSRHKADCRRVGRSSTVTVTGRACSGSCHCVRCLGSCLCCKRALLNLDIEVRPIVGHAASPVPTCARTPAVKP